MAEAKKTTRARKTAEERIATAPAGPGNDEEVKTPAAEAKAETDEVAALKAQLEAMKAEMAAQMESFKEAMQAAQKPQVIQVTASTVPHWDSSHPSPACSPDDFPAPYIGSPGLCLSQGLGASHHGRIPAAPLYYNVSMFWPPPPPFPPDGSLPHPRS